MNPATVVTPEVDISDHFKRIATAYWQKLVREGVPREEACEIAAAIARFDILQRVPSIEQKRLISEFSRFVCRAQLWRSDLLL